MDNEKRMYTCEQCRSVLGVIQHERRRARLNVFRQPQTAPSAEFIQEARNYALIDLEAGTVVCGHCGARRTWRLSEQALSEFLAKRAGRSYGLEQSNG